MRILRNIVAERSELAERVSLTGDLPSDGTPNKIALWNRTNGIWEMYWNGSNWVPARQLENSSVYVDGTNGTDAIGYGDGSGTAAFRTLQYAWDSSPADGVGTLTIYLSNNTFNETNYQFFNKRIGVQIIGTPTYQHQSESITAVVAGRRGTIQQTGGGLTVNAHTNHVILIRQGAAQTIDSVGVCCGITSNTATTYTCAGVPALSTDNIFDVISEGTIITTPNIYLNSPGGISFRYLSFVDSTCWSGYGISPNRVTPRGGSTYFYGCWFDASTSIFSCYAWGPTAFYGCIFRHALAGHPIYSRGLDLIVYYCRLLRTSGTKVGTGILNQYGGGTSNIYACDIDNMSNGVLAQSNAYSFVTSSTITNCTNGIIATTNGTMQKASNSYSGCTSNETTQTDGFML